MSSASSTDQHRGYRHPFVFGFHYLGGVGDTPRTLTELAMSQFSAETRCSSGWWNCFKTNDFRNRWADFALERVWKVRTPSSYADVGLSEKQVNYVLDELEGYNNLRDEPHRCQVSAFERIWESDSLLGFQQTVALAGVLKDLKRGKKVNEDGVTTNIIDPSRFCLVYNRTLVSHLNGRNFRPIAPPPSSDVYTVSPNFALLPTDVFISQDGSSVEFLSYMNDLHPTQHKSAYTLLQELLSGFVPLLEHALTDLHRNNPLVQRIPGRCKYSVWEEPEAPEHSDDEEGWITYEQEMREWTLNRPIDLPDVPSSGYRGGLEKRRHVVNLRDRVVQVFVSASEIALHPGGTEYPGSSWHVEGMRNERIVACGFHCLSASNITDTSIQFRMAVTYPRGFSAGDTGATMRTWGIRDGDACHQYVGDVSIREGLSLVFPNIYQHRQTPFKLADPSREGHLTGVWFYLVDPEIRPIVSTSLVAPQQKDWIHNAMDENLDRRLPNEVIEKILEDVEGLMTDEEAEGYRKELLDARKRFTQASNSYHFCIPFDIWNGPEVVP